jgi:hypothetical protein
MGRGSLSRPLRFGFRPSLSSQFHPKHSSGQAGRVRTVRGRDEPPVAIHRRRSCRKPPAHGETPRRAPSTRPRCRGRAPPRRRSGPARLDSGRASRPVAIRPSSSGFGRRLCASAPVSASGIARVSAGNFCGASGSPTTRWRSTGGTGRASCFRQGRRAARRSCPSAAPDGGGGASSVRS